MFALAITLAIIAALVPTLAVVITIRCIEGADAKLEADIDEAMSIANGEF